ncbi:MAG: hypothetical protein QXO44_01885 [Thermoplasmatales archaeon]
MTVIVVMIVSGSLASLIVLVKRGHNGRQWFLRSSLLSSVRSIMEPVKSQGNMTKL